MLGFWNFFFVMELAYFLRFVFQLFLFYGVNMCQEDIIKQYFERDGSTTYH
eukprot:TRINITY_DN2637_c0_g1_i1.p2 TRINITY_DN2637_c0_g1~~TRINITY_DN2637_c0_g1_i1.p2  ORF type:complete len:51 (-),score=4.11 TRINITY_DN2637_c0_g1_i1:204-356(-)